MKTGRPTNYTPELAKEICNAIASSNKGVRRLCKEHGNLPCADTIYRWISTHKEFSDQYARAKRQQIEVIVDEIIEIADDTSQDTSINDDGKMITNHEHIQRSRLRIDTRKWLAAKLAPKLYGDTPEQKNYQDEADQDMAEEIQRIRQAYREKVKREY